MVEVANSRNESIETPLSAESPLLPPWNQKTNNRAKELWSLLRCSVKLTTSLVKKADIQPTTISHGVHYSRKISHEDVISDVLYNHLTQEIITIDHQFVRVFHKDGRRKDIVDCGEQLTKIILCSHSRQYAALTTNDEIKLMNFEFELISTAKSQNKIICMMYNESTSEVITAGTGNLTTWCFRYGNKYMIPHKEIKQGLTWLDSFDKLALELTQSHSQRCYAVCGTSVAVFNLHQGYLQTYKKDLHVRNITSILFFNPLKNIVTGSRDGSIKLWDENFGIRLVFVGHHGPISSLKLYPQGPYIMSSSHDCSIRVWSMETCDEVDLIKVEEPVLGIGTSPGESSLFSYSNFTVDLWTLTHTHQIFTTVGNTVMNMKSTFYPKMADRVMSLSEDGTIRLLSPINGTVLTTLLPPKLGPIIQQSDNDTESKSGDPINPTTPTKVLLDAVYCLPHEFLFAAYADGSLVKASSLSNPMSIKEKWKYEEGCEINCLCLYEYVLNITKLKKNWLNRKARIIKRKRKTKNPKYGNKTLLLVGRRDGYIANIDIETGEIIYKTEAHGAKGVIGIIANVRNDQVVTAGQDNVVKVWKMFPNTWESLSLMMSFYCAHTPRHMSISGTKLAVAFQQFASATYTIVMYDLHTKERSDHSPKQDHTDELCGLTCCHRLKLFASASIDGTVKIWNYDNELVRIIKLNDIPKSITFCNERGNILIGLGRNIHHIDHTSYLPKMYIFKMVCMDFPEPIKEEAIPLNKLLTTDLKKEELRKITFAKSSFMRMDYTWDPMSLKEQEMMSSEERGRAGEYALLSARDHELERIRDGALRPKRANRKTSKRTESIAFKKYMALFWDRPKKLTIEDEDDFDPDPAPERDPTPMSWEPERKIGFFPPIDAAKPIKDMLESGLEKDKHLHESGPEYSPRQKYIINPCGFIPNSILIKLLWPQDEVKKLAEDAWKPPTLSEEQLQMIQSMESMKKQETYSSVQPMVSQGVVSPIQGTEEDEDNIYMMDSEMSSVEEELQYEDEDTVIDPSAGPPKKVPKPKMKIDKKPSALMLKMQGAMKTPTPPPKDPTPPPTPPPPIIAPKVVKQTKPTKPIVKFVSRPPPPKDPTPPPKTPLPPTPPPPTPPPNFLTQFEDLPWFTRQKDYIFQRLTKPYTAAQFFKVICDVLGISIDWEHRCGIVDALLLLWQQEDIKDTRNVTSALGFIFNSSVPPSSKDSGQATYLRSALKLNQAVAGNSEEFIVELLTEYLEGDPHHKTYIRSVLLEQGLKDPHLYLAKELESWEIWNLDETRPLKQQLKEMVRRWYSDWNMRFKNHLEQTMNQLRKGDLSGKIRRSGQSKTSQGQRAQLTVQASDVSLKNVTIMEVVNYFCEIMLEEELERVRQANIKPEPTKNTVLVLPKLKGKQAIVRLGEMHTALRVRQRSELATEYKLNPLQRPYPDLVAAFTNKLSLPTTQIHMNPFPSEIDRFDDISGDYEPILLTLRCPAQKYFIPEKSYVHMA